MSRRMTSLLPLLLLGGIGCGSNEPVAAADTKPTATAPVAPVTADTKPATTAVVVAKALSLKELTLAAIAKSEAAVKADPKDHEQFARLGEARYYAGEDDTAIAALREAVQLKPSEMEYHWELARILTGLGKKEQAAKVQADLLAKDKRYGLIVESILGDEKMRNDKIVDEAVWHVLRREDADAIQAVFEVDARKATLRMILNGSLPHVTTSQRNRLTERMVRLGEPAVEPLQKWEGLCALSEIKLVHAAEMAGLKALEEFAFTDIAPEVFKARAMREAAPGIAYFKSLHKWADLTSRKIDEAKTPSPVSKPKDE